MWGGKKERQKQYPCLPAAPVKISEEAKNGKVSGVYRCRELLVPPSWLREESRERERGGGAMLVVGRLLHVYSVYALTSSHPLFLGVVKYSNICHAIRGQRWWWVGYAVCVDGILCAL